MNEYPYTRVRAPATYLDDHLIPGHRLLDLPFPRTFSGRRNKPYVILYKLERVYSDAQAQAREDVL